MTDALGGFFRVSSIGLFCVFSFFLNQRKCQIKGIFRFLHLKNTVMTPPMLWVQEGRPVTAASNLAVSLLSVFLPQEWKLSSDTPAPFLNMPKEQSAHHSYHGKKTINCLQRMSQGWLLFSSVLFHMNQNSLRMFQLLPPCTSKQVIHSSALSPSSLLSSRQFFLTCPIF